jgi:L-lactate dehydrogenase complex protein LldG
MNSRESILAAVRSNQPTARPLPELPPFRVPCADRLTAFSAALRRMGGAVEPLRPGEGAADCIARLFPQSRVTCSAVLEVQGTRELAHVPGPHALEDVDVAVVRAGFGVAETGSVWLSEQELGFNAMAFLPQHLVVLLDPQAIVESLHDAYRHPGFHSARYAVLVTGPSATADIEGVLVRGAQGIRSLTVLPVGPPAA